MLFIPYYTKLKLINLYHYIVNDEKMDVDENTQRNIKEKIRNFNEVELEGFANELRHADEIKQYVNGVDMYEKIHEDISIPTDVIIVFEKITDISIKAEKSYDYSDFHVIEIKFQIGDINKLFVLPVSVDSIIIQYHDNGKVCSIKAKELEVYGKVQYVHFSLSDKNITITLGNIDWSKEVKAKVKYPSLKN